MLRFTCLLACTVILGACTGEPAPRTADRALVPGGIVGAADISHKNVSDYPNQVTYDGGATSAQLLSSPVAPLAAKPSHQASQIWAVIKSNLGAMPKTQRDVLDTRIINCVDGLASCPRLASPASLPYTAPTATAADDQPLADTDNDGMADVEEWNVGGSVGTADHNTVMSNGYTRLQNYLWWRGRRL